MGLKRAILRLIAGDILVPKRQKFVGPRTAVEWTPRLVCFGCAHSAGMAEYPSHPSGERPCMFCIRNPNQARDLAEVQKRSPGLVSPRYDNEPVSTIPADQYIATDRLLRDVPDGLTVFT